MRDEDLKYILIDFQARNRVTGELMGQEVMKVHVDKLKNFFQENGMEAPLIRRVSSNQQQQQQSTSSSSSSPQLSPPPVENVDPTETSKKKDGGSSGSSSGSSGGGGDPKKWTMKSWRPVPPAEVSNASSSAGAASLLFQEERATASDAIAGPSDSFSDRSMSPPTLSPVSGSSPKKIRLRSSKLAVLSPMINVADDPAVMEDDGPPPSPPTAGPSSRPSAAAPAQAPENQRNSGRKKRGRRGRSGNNFPNLKDSAVPLCTPPPARTKAKVVGVSAVPLNRWEKDLKNKPVVLEELSKLPTEWGVIIADEPVYARWSDNKFYSGVVKEKGDNDTWIIEFDDSIEAPASKTHILPIRVLGVGVKGVYTPDQFFEAKDAEIVGQKFEVDNEAGKTYVKYAIKIVGETEPTWCSRRQLAIKGKEGIKLRKSVKIQVVDKGGDVSLDNIVFNRRRGRKPPPEIEKKKIEKVPKARERPAKGGKSKKVDAKDATAAVPPKISPTATTSKSTIATSSTNQALPSSSAALKICKPVSGHAPPAAAPPPPPVSMQRTAIQFIEKKSEKMTIVQDDSSEDELLDIPLLTSECHRTVRAAPRPCLAVAARIRASESKVGVGKPVGKMEEKKQSKLEKVVDKKEKGDDRLKKKDEKNDDDDDAEDEEIEDEEDGSMEDEDDDKLEIIEKNEDEESFEEEEEVEEEEDEEGKLEIVEKDEGDGEEEEEMESLEEEEQDDKPVEPLGIEQEEDENNNGTDEGDDNEVDDDDDDIFGEDVNENGGKSPDEFVDGHKEDDDDPVSMDDEQVDSEEMEIDEASSSSSSLSAGKKETTLQTGKSSKAPPFLKYDRGGKRVEKKKGSKGKARESPPMPNIIIPLEPTPKSVKFFEGYQFYITSCDRQDNLVPSKVYDKYHTGSFNKDTLIKMIEHGGGQVLGKIGSENCDKEKTPFVISNCFSRTAEYLYGVAACYPCVDRKWIAKCLEQQRFVYWSNFTLPTGYSLEEKRVIMAHYQKPLEKKRIFMAPENKYAEWGPIAKVGGCLNMNDIQIGPGKLLPPKVGIVIILDENMDKFKAVIAEADKRHVRVVKHEWLVQTVITGKLAPFHVPKYCILDQKTVTTEVKSDPYADALVTVSPPPRPSSRQSEESLLSVGPV